MKNDDRKEIRKKLFKRLKGSAKDNLYEPMKKSLQKITIASDSKEGLQEGLSKAQQILAKRSEMLEEDDEDEYDCGGVERNKKNKKSY